MENFVFENDITEAIASLVEEKRHSQKLLEQFPNPLLRDDVFDLLDLYCTVVFFPLPNEKNNGFHLVGVPDKTGLGKDFVYINTAQTLEKQVFTAAHELGHIWEVDECIAKKCNLTLTPDISEHIINRFASELMMPKEQFITAYASEITKYQKENNKITIFNMMKILTNLINRFFVPLKAIVYRLRELQMISNDVATLFGGKGMIPEELLYTMVRELMIVQGYTRFIEPTNKRWIDGLAEHIEQAEKRMTLNANKLDNLKKQFKLTGRTDTIQWEKTINMKAPKEIGDAD